uniref:Ig-like domain-containing protein n=1 Tax=Salarias fasciatus TaxID=181472 RepID=A0A672G0E0_SALFA
KMYKLFFLTEDCLLSVAVTQGQTDWGVNYGPPEICALKGSTVEIRSTFTYPLRKNGLKTTVEQMFWFIQRENSEPVDLRTDSQYAGRVRYDCGDRKCILSITDLTERDSAEYRFKFITNHPGGSFTGKPGVKLSVTGLKVQIKTTSCRVQYCKWSEMECSSSCVPQPSSYIWYQNGKKIDNSQKLYSAYFYSVQLSTLKFSLLLPDAPKPPSVSVSPSGEIVEGSSVTLTCSSDANPAASYSWYRGKQTLSEEQDGLLHFTSISYKDRGNYYCQSKNQHGQTNSMPQYLDVHCELETLIRFRVERLDTQLIRFLVQNPRRQMKKEINSVQYMGKKVKTYTHSVRPSPSMTSDLNTVGVIIVQLRTI